MKNILKFLSVITLIPTTSLLVISCTTQTKETKKTKKPNTEVKKPKNPTPTFSPNKQTIDKIKNILEQQSEAFGSFHTFQDVVDQIKVYAQNQGIKDLDKLELLDKKLANKTLTLGNNKNNLKLKYFDIEIPFALKNVLENEVKTKYSSTDSNEIIQLGYKKHGDYIQLNIENKTITKVPVTLPLKINSFYKAFKDLKSETITNLDKWDTSNVKILTNAFERAVNFNTDISEWNTSNVTEMTNAFYDAKKFNQNIGKWNTSKVTDMSAMFDGAESFNQDLNNWNVKNVQNMAQMFWGAIKFNGKISDWDVSNVASTNNMFADAESFNQDISKWDTSNVNSMDGMFARAKSFTWSLKKWNVKKVVKAQGFRKENKNNLGDDKIPSFEDEVKKYIDD
ncbi:Prolipoprotein [Mycoplasma leachii 99/014/6]|uniref:BspA family leucine-rich repeat surface protein n=1 Tax=Mycoplasma leachii TaxID=2105 RepID=UPI0002177105|nr:BspA family leucine-rich repeat surface protein [Mycoplasma leachii]CBV67323.1 Prolipoprotein [Mycoplasma leachii 99/014/6]